MSSGCGDVLSLTDLQTAKKHQLFEAEVITGKQGGVAGGADIDYATNPVTLQTQKTLPAILRDLGFDPASFDFTTGGTLTTSDRNKVVYDPVSTTWYSWAGTLPKVVPAATNPLLDSNWKPQTDPDLRSDLASPGGAAVVSNALIEAPTVLAASGFIGLTEGKKIRTYRHNVDVISDWIYTTSAPDATTFKVSAVGGYLVLLTPNFASAGLKTGAYSPADAWYNRNVITALCLDTRFSEVSVGAPGSYYVLGSVVPNRSNFKFNIEKGCRLIGRYDDPAVPASIGSNTGGMLDFVLRGNYHVNGDYTNTGTLTDVHVVLDGIIETEYNAIHSQLNNNNCIGFYNVKDCSVTGTGLVNGSDHRGINCDGLSDNVRFDIAAIRNTRDEPFVMNVNANTGYGYVRVGRMYDMNFGGSATLRVGVRVVGGFVDVHIGSFEWNGSMQPVLVGAYNAQEVNVWCGTINGVTHGLRSYETRKAALHSGQFRNTFYAIGRAGVATGVTDEFYLGNIKALDATTTTAFYAETNQDSFRRLTIYKCDFAPCPIGFLYVRGLTGAGTPDVIDIEENKDPTVSGWTASYINILKGSIKTGLVTSGATSFTYNYALQGWNYNNVTVLINNGSNNYPFTLNLRTRATGTLPFVYNIGGVVINVTVSGTTITFAIPSGGTFVSAVAHN